MIRVAPTLVALLVVWTQASAMAKGVFDLARGAPDRVLVTRSGLAPPQEMPSTEMQRQIAGVLATLDRREYARLRATEQTHRVFAEGADLSRAQALFSVHLVGDRESVVVRVVRHLDGSVLAQRDDDPSAIARLDAEKLTAFAGLLPAYRGDFSELSAPVANGETAELPRPHTPGIETLDDRTLRNRLYGGKRTSVRAVTRRLIAETLFARPPEDYDPRRRSGVVVWIDPTDRGVPPTMLHEACDELGLVAIGIANNGNGRPFVDRMQLVLDAAATAQARFHIDPDRVYLVGFSGGGRISSMMVACFPDLFAGAVPIGGLNHSSPARTPDGKNWPKTYERPRGERLAKLRTRRVAPISGPADFNYEQMIAYGKGWQRDRVPYRFIDVPGLAHELPTPAVMLDALQWVDEPWREARDEQLIRDGELAERTLARADGRGLSQADRERLIEIADRNPWTDLAERVIASLGD